MSKESDDSIARHLLEGVDLSGMNDWPSDSVKSTSVESEELSSPAVEWVNLPSELWDNFQNYQVNILRDNGAASAMILLGERKGNCVNVNDGILLEQIDASRPLSDEDILQGVELCQREADPADGVVIGVMLAQRRTKEDVAALIKREENALQVVITGEPSVTRDLNRSVARNTLNLSLYTPSPQGGVQAIPKFTIEYLLQE